VRYFIAPLTFALAALSFFAIPAHGNPVVVSTQPVVAPPFRLPSPPFQTAAQTEAASRYWRTHSIGRNHAEQQTSAEATASRYWQTHPTYGHQGQPGFVPRYNPFADTALVRPQSARPDAP